jgi:CheY-like chemotaxis protein
MVQGLRAQAAVQEADRRKSEFLATLSHELRNPLTPIRFALDVLDRSQGTSAEAMEVLRRQLRQLIRLVDDLLDLTRLSRNKMQIRREGIDLVTLVTQAIDACRPDLDAAGHTLVTRLPDTPTWIDADADRMTQVLTNLLNNAIRYTPSGGTITVDLAVHDGDAVLSVADSGVGLTSADAARVFDMFTQVGGPGSGGLGIGLSLVRGIVEQHGGQVEARSDGPGCGSEFRVVLPIAAMPARPAVSETRPTRAGRKRRVLVVDDNVDSAEMISALLEMHGHEVSVAHDADGALAAVREFSPDAALLDIGLPGITGYDLARQLRTDRRTRQMQLIALTGWGQENDRARAREAGFDVHLTKPVEPHIVLAALDAGTSTPASAATGGGATGSLQMPHEHRPGREWPDAHHGRHDD